MMSQVSDKLINGQLSNIIKWKFSFVTGNIDSSKWKREKSFNWRINSSKCTPYNTTPSILSNWNSVADQIARHKGLIVSFKMWTRLNAFLFSGPIFDTT